MSAASAKTQEPSMDEILASIRRIIADDQEPVKNAVAPAELNAEPDTELPVESDQPRVVLSARPSDDHEEVSFEPMSEPDIIRDEPPPALKLADVMAASPPPRSNPADAHRPPPDQPRPVETRGLHEGMPRLVSNETTASVNHAFNMLSHTVLAQSARTLEDLVTDMLKPMLKTWLDDNLPPLVERLVRAEIERVSRGGR